MRGIGHTTHTLAEMQVSARVYEEIAAKLREAGYDHAFMEDGVISMQGIGITRPQPSAMAVRMREAREKLGLTQKEAARKVFVALPSLIEYEEGGMVPQGRTLEKIARVYKVTPDWLRDGQGTLS